MAGLINIISFISFGLLNIQVAALIYFLKNIFSIYKVNQVQFILISIFINVGFLLYFDRGVDWYRIVDMYQSGSLDVTKPLRAMTNQLVGPSISSFLFYWFLVRVMFYFNIFAITKALLENSTFRKFVVAKRVSIGPLVLVSLALFPVSTVVSFESATAMTFVLRLWMARLNSKQSRSLKDIGLIFLVHPGGVLGLILIMPAFLFSAIISLVVFPNFAFTGPLQVLANYAQVKALNYIYGPWSFYAGIGELISPFRAIVLLMLISFSLIFCRNFKVSKKHYRVFLLLILIIVITVPFRTIYFRIGDPLLILTALKLASNTSNVKFFYLTCFVALVSTPNVYFIAGFAESIRIEVSSFSYFEQIKTNIDLGPTENIYRGSLINRD